MVRGTDTDILIILLGMLGKHHEEEVPVKYNRLVYDCGQGNNQRYIDINRIHVALEAEAAGFTNALIGLHAFTGTDYTASFYHKAKKTPFNLLLNKRSSE